jgi:hypothetical protein
MKILIKYKLISKNKIFKYILLINFCELKFKFESTCSKNNIKNAK